MNRDEKSEFLFFVKHALSEDVGDGDHTSLSTVPAGRQGIAEVLIKDHGILAGVEEAVGIFQVVDATLETKVFLQDGTSVKPGDIVMQVQGHIHSILKAERLVLNVMQRMSGVATMTGRIASLLEGTHTKVLDTRKTTPLLRFLEKKAVRIGGGVNHRLDSMT